MNEIGSQCQNLPSMQYYCYCGLYTYHFQGMYQYSVIPIPVFCIFTFNEQ